jgi:polysaccharide biosynthesis transport protein
VSSPDTQRGLPTIDLREYLRILRARRWAVLGAFAVVMSGVTLYSLTRTSVYTAEADVLVQTVDLSPTQAGRPPAPNMATEQRLVKSPTVAAIAAELLGSRAPITQLLRHVDVGIATNTEILQVRYSDQVPSKAQRAANAFARGYLTFRQQQVLDELDATSKPLQQRLDKLNRQLLTANEQLAKAASATERASLQVEINSLVGQVAVLQQRLSDLAPPSSLQVGQVVAPAQLPGSPSSPRLALNFALGLLLGAILGISVALIWERLDDHIRETDDLRALTGAPTLAVIPSLPIWRDRAREVLVSEQAPDSPTSEAYRTLRASIMYAASHADVKTILITSPRSGEGKSATTANLGVALAQAGKSVVLVDADLRRPRLRRFFSQTDEAGLTDVLAGSMELRDALLHLRRGGDASGANLRLLNSGSPDGNLDLLLSSGRVQRVLEALRSSADVVLLDSAPLLGIADTLILAPLVDAVLLVADAQRSTRGSLETARQHLLQLGAPVLGTVLNNYRPPRGSPYLVKYPYDRREPESAPGTSVPRPESVGTGPGIGPRQTRTGNGGRSIRNLEALLGVPPDDAPRPKEERGTDS